MDEIEKKIMERDCKIDFLEYKIKEKLPIDFEACKEILDHQTQLKALQSILKEYWNYIVDWGKLNEIKFITNDFSFVNANMETEEIIWNDNYNSEEIRFSDIEGKYIGSNLEFETDNERYKHEKYQELISQISSVIKYKDKLLRKIELLESVRLQPQINKKYIDFWKQFTKKVNPKTQQPYLTNEDFEIFMNQAFGGEQKKKTFNPDISKKELCHAGWLFYVTNKNDFRSKSEVAQIMKDNFPVHFPGELGIETEKLRDGLDDNKRVFHKI